MKQGDLILLVSPKGKRYLRRFVPDMILHTQEGMIRFADVAEAGCGGAVTTHLGHPFRILRPSTYDLVKGVKRSTQIMYPKEIGYVLLKLGIGPGVRVIEAGSGSGGLTLALAWHVGDTGRVYTFERRPEFFALSGENLEAVGLCGRVSRFHHDIATGFLPDCHVPGDPLTDPSDADALFLDVRTPWDYLEAAAAVVRPGAPVGFLLPTVNQISELLAAMEASPFEDVEVLEILVRRYKPVPERLRPEDRMVAHTGFLVFARHGGLAAYRRPAPLPPAPGPDNGHADPDAGPDDARAGEDAATD
ncbi:tRNA (adenine-N1)-methyltransferase [Solidesulfovibrio sp.]|uniref:tRNA (adenine-N1)-methyltransferase n=1 Tax=Solidesulfovibrio sp. TaxID=2910990 RepID=UPI002B1FEC8E|nr:tRNA (adenine-N1)-methyltransferase [Solidesulfovibrio sp.]MEA4855512.1 tRNA (adenine-N1)-methyltransferase [Solidesulfovibrio sp.]